MGRRIVAIGTFIVLVGGLAAAVGDDVRLRRSATSTQTTLTQARAEIHAREGQVTDTCLAPQGILGDANQALRAFIQASGSSPTREQTIAAAQAAAVAFAVLDAKLEAVQLQVTGGLSTAYQLEASGVSLYRSLWERVAAGSELGDAAVLVLQDGEAHRLLVEAGGALESPMSGC